MSRTREEPGEREKLLAFLADFEVQPRAAA
jgi:hypothetical protein